MKILANTVLLFILCGNVAFADGPLSINGYDWGEWSQNSKMYYVLGWMACGVSASMHTYGDIPKYSKSPDFRKDIIKLYASEGILWDGVSVRQIIDTMDNIYLDSRAKTLPIPEIMPFVAGRLNAGWSLTQLDTAISITIRRNTCAKEEMVRDRNLEECDKIRKELNDYLHKFE